MVALIERRPGRWKIVQSSATAEPQEDAVRFSVTVPGRGEARVSYRLQMER